LKLQLQARLKIKYQFDTSSSFLTKSKFSLCVHHIGIVEGLQAPSLKGILCNLMKISKVDMVAIVEPRIDGVIADKRISEPWLS
jgi:hypothetical protein